MPDPFPGIDPYLESQGYWPDFHARFLIYCCDDLAARLPASYVAQIDERIRLVEPLSEEGSLIRPDLMVEHLESTQPLPLTPAPVGMGNLQPVVIPLMELEEVRETRIRILHTSDRSVVTILELLSPSNKENSGFYDYLDKRHKLLAQPINLVELDLLLGGQRLLMRKPLPPGDFYALIARRRVDRIARSTAGRFVSRCQWCRFHSDHPTAMLRSTWRSSIPRPSNEGPIPGSWIIELLCGFPSPPTTAPGPSSWLRRRRRVEAFRTNIALLEPLLAWKRGTSPTGVPELPGWDVMQRRGESLRLPPEVGPMLRLAGPVILAELGWMAMGLVDIVMVGRLGPAAIGAIGIGNVLFIGVSIVGFGLLLGLDTVVSQAFGAGRIDDCRKTLVQGVYLALALTLPLMAVVRFAAGRLGWSGVDPAVVPLATIYLDAVVWSLPSLMLHTACRRYLQATNAVRPVMVALFVANAVKVAANWVLVYGHLGASPLGVAGAGWSTVLARLCMAAITVLAILIDDRRSPVRFPAAFRPDWRVLGTLLRLGWPAAGQLVLEFGVFGVATVLAGRLGTVPLAAHEIGLNVCGFTFMVPLGVSSAGAVRVGHALGRGDPHAAARAGRAALALGVGFMAASAFVLLLCAERS